MAKIVILEGARGAGKTTLAQKLRSKIFGTTLINPTGFPEDGDKGKYKIVNYYQNLILYLDSLSNEYSIILDRSFISEMVYSKIYKEYDFRPYYNAFCDQLFFSNKHDITLFYMMISPEQVGGRLSRDKAKLFNSVKDKEVEVMKQQGEYEAEIANLASMLQSRHIPRAKMEIYAIHPLIKDAKAFAMRTLEARGYY
ncbi:thymidylate kinase [compost metagenome]